MNQTFGSILYCFPFHNGSLCPHHLPQEWEQRVEMVKSPELHLQQQQHQQKKRKEEERKRAREEKARLARLSAIQVAHPAIMLGIHR